MVHKTYGRRRVVVRTLLFVAAVLILVALASYAALHYKSSADTGATGFSFVIAPDDPTTPSILSDIKTGPIKAGSTVRIFLTNTGGYYIPWAFGFDVSGSSYIPSTISLSPLNGYAISHSFGSNIGYFNGTFLSKLTAYGLKNLRWDTRLTDDQAALTKFCSSAAAQGTGSPTAAQIKSCVDGANAAASLYKNKSTSTLDMVAPTPGLGYPTVSPFASKTDTSGAISLSGQFNYKMLALPILADVDVGTAGIIGVAATVQTVAPASWVYHNPIGGDRFKLCATQKVTNPNLPKILSYFTPSFQDQLNASNSLCKSSVTTYQPASMTVVSDPLTTLKTPTDQSLNYAAPTLSWSAVNGAGSYVVKFAAKPANYTAYDYTNCLTVYASKNNQACVGDPFEAPVYQGTVSDPQASQTFTPHDISYGSSSIWNSLPADKTYIWEVYPVISDTLRGLPAVSSFSKNIIGAPTNLKPADGSSIIENAPPTFSWDAPTGADHYRFEISNDANFGHIAYGLNNLTQPSIDGNLFWSTLSNQKYYWRVTPYSSDNQAGNAASATVTRTALLGKTTLTAPADNAVLTTLTNFTWSAANATNYKFEVSPAGVNDFSSPKISQPTTTASLAGSSLQLDNGVYYWRVTAYSADGQTAVSDVWSFTLLPAPANLKPTSGAFVIETTAPTFSWDAVAKAASYHVEFSTDQNFIKSGLVTDGTTALTEVNSSNFWSGFTNGTTYYWHVIPYVNGRAGTPSATATFTKVAALAKPTLKTPVSGANLFLTTSFSWDTVAEATSYKLEISSGSQNDFSSPKITQTVSGTSATVSSGDWTGLDGGNHYWRVTASASYGRTSVSDAGLFNKVILAAPTGLTPNNQTFVKYENPTFSWDAVPYANKYHFQIGTDSSFGSFEYEATVSAPSVKDFWPASSAKLSKTGTYSWHVIPLGPNGEVGPASLVQSVTRADLAVPTNLTVNLKPAEGASAVENAPPTFGWDAVPFAASYHFQLADNANFTGSSLIEQTPSQPTSGSFSQWSGLSGNKYFWRVIPYGSDNLPGPASAAQIINRPALDLSAPALIAPGDTSTFVNTEDPTFSWGTVANAASYLFQISTDQNNFTTSASSYYQQTVTTVPPQVKGFWTTLKDTGDYHWRVTPIGPNGQSGSSSQLRTVTRVALTAPVLATPLNGATFVENSAPTFIWNAVAHATNGYHFEISANQNFNSLAFEQTSSQTTLDGSVFWSTRLINQRYYWRVTPIGPNQPGPASEVRSIVRVALIAGPTLLTPANGATITAATNFSWSAVTDAATYTFEISPVNTDDFANPALVTPSLTTPSATIDWTTIGGNGTYHWKVIAHATDGREGASADWSFIKNFPAPALAKPTLNYPVGTLPAEEVKTATFSWSAVAGATSYDVALSDNGTAGLTTPIATQTGLTTASFPATNVWDKLTSEKTYTWQVTAHGADNAASVSDPKDFLLHIGGNPTVTVVVPTFTLHHGWNLITIPGTLTLTNASQSIFSGYTAWWWDAANSKYVNDTSDSSHLNQLSQSVSSGKGYWIYSASNLDQTFVPSNIASFTANTSSKIDNLVAGAWNMIGNPYNRAIDVSAIQVKIGSDTKSYAAARAAGQISDFFAWDPVAYNWRTSNESSNASVSALTGLFVKNKTNQTISLVIP